MIKRKIAKQAEEDEAMIKHMVEFRVQAWVKTVGYIGPLGWIYDLFDIQTRELVKYGYMGMRP